MAFIDVRGDVGCAQALEGSEDIEVLVLDHEQASRLCDDTSLHVDAKAWIVLHMYQQLGKLE